MLSPTSTVSAPPTAGVNCPEDELASRHPSIATARSASRVPREQTQNRTRRAPRMRLCVCSAVNWTTHRSSAGGFCGCQLRTPKEHTSPSTSQAPGPRETTMPLESGGDPWRSSPADEEGDSPDGGQSRRISGAWHAGEDRGRGPLVLCFVRSSPCRPSTFADRHIGLDSEHRIARRDREWIRLDEPWQSRRPRQADTLTDTGPPEFGRSATGCQRSRGGSRLRALADITVAVSMIRARLLTHIPPGAVARHHREPGLSSAYTPYQPRLVRVGWKPC